MEREKDQVNRREADSSTPEGWQQIELEAQKVIKGYEGYTTIKALIKAKREDLVRIIHQYYPGGIFDLNEVRVNDHPT